MNMQRTKSVASPNSPVRAEACQGSPSRRVRRDVKEAVERIWKGAVHWNRPLASCSTLGVGGPAEALIFPENEKELVDLLQDLRQQALPWQVIGRGSNILVADRGLPGVVIVLGSRFAAITRERESGQELVRAEAGCSLPTLVRWCAEQGLSGFEFAVGIPGSVGGAVVMNAGAWGSDMSGVLDSFVIVDESGRRQDLAAAAETFGYRRWQSRAKSVVVAARFKVRPAERLAIETRCRRYLQERKEKQPQSPSAGSFFKNPPGQAAGRLIEQAGLKGTRIGGAMVSPRHANFLVNTGRATAEDFVSLMRLVQNRVRESAGIELEPEVQLLGFEEGTA